MMLGDDLLQALFEDVGVDLRRRDVGVAEELLHRAQVGAAIEQVAREGEAQDVRADALGVEAGFGGEFLQLEAEMLAGDVALGAAGGKQPLARANGRGVRIGQSRWLFRMVASHEPRCDPPMGPSPTSVE